MSKNPLFLRFLNQKTSVFEMLQSFSRSKDPYTSESATEALNDPPSLDDFREELTDAVADLVKEGPGDEFSAFVDHYMKSSLEEDVKTVRGHRGENVFRVARVKDNKEPWVQGLVCYNLCLYIRAFGLDALKRCKVCDKFFAHKGKYAVYCSDVCKANKNKK